MTTNRELFERRSDAVAAGVGIIHPIATERAENARLWDVEGNEYIDFAAGIAVLNTGHRHPRVMAAVEEQLGRFTHTNFNVSAYEPYVALAERLNAITPGDFAKKTVLVNSGAEAVENAVKIAKAYTGRSAVIGFGGGFHGRTLLTMGLTGKVRPYKAGFGPMPADIFHARFPNEVHGVSVDDAVRSLEELLRFDVDPQRVAALIIEPVLGEGGFYAAPPAFMQALRRIADEHGICLIVDEVQTGFARTGRRFAVEHSGVTPDIITMAKGLAGGMPLAAVTGRAEIMDAGPAGGLGGTYGGNPLSAAAALAVQEVIDDEGLIQRAAIIGERLTTGIGEIASEVGAVRDVRGLGAMVAVEFFDGDQPSPAMAADVMARARAHGLLVLTCGIHGNVVRLLPPLTATDADVEGAVERLGAAIREAAGSAPQRAAG
ncbi:4-aminobutyrate aminotransferase GabT [wastewater metagenome]|uniref:4-aminobutyrate aminotransferase GabT n=2 Tax=unclassified sequences TaxID=12908 RepID=A0A5B8R9F6_9ZZZZ|nr:MULTISPECIES: 4-aminobutyrate--2-oxoglutarate transaminase [Arhodomonas]MCS4504924.1 4-aminobutyrate--2-oxoglutarate transaminase [Arhodomonas aquaeolei]QEA04124.1 4-aminobutyrate aminotransferase GabT [uncultured organism]